MYSVEDGKVRRVKASKLREGLNKIQLVYGSAVRERVSQLLKYPA